MVRRCLNCMKEFEIPAGYENERFCCPHCGFVEGTPPAEINHLFPGTILQNRYQIGVVVGFGGFGVTYKAWDRELGITVAIKEYYPAGTVTREPGKSHVIVYEGSHRDDFYKGLDRFLEEARKTAQFEHSQYIVQVKNFFQENNTAYLVMEYLEGISLKEYLKQYKYLDPADAIQITDSVIEALKEMHNAGILHRDIGPGNIFLCGNKVKVIDFGAARLSDEDREVTRSIVLTPGFAPPEQYQSKSKQGPWTDIYALAATLYNMVTGKKPDESTDRVQEDLVPEANKVNSAVSEKLSNAIMKGMAVNPELRFRTVEEFADAIHERTEVDTPKQELKKKKKKRLIQILAVAAVLLVGALIAGIHYMKEYRKTHLKAATISVWVSYGEDAGEEKAKQRFEDITAYFKSNYPQITLEVEYIPEKDYQNRVTEAGKNGKLPAVYMADGLGQAGTSFAEDLDGVYDDLSLSGYYYLEEYKKSDMKSIPMGLDVPVAYVRRGDGIDLSTIEISSFDQLREEPSKGYYISVDSYSMQFNSFKGKYEFKNGLQMDETAKKMISETAESGYAADTAEKAREGFKNGEITYYMADLRELGLFNDMAGIYAVKPIRSGEVTGEFCDRWSISAGLETKERAAAEQLLVSMLTENGQTAMHITNTDAIPINKDVCQEFIRLNEQLSFLEEYMEDLHFLYEDRAEEREASRELQDTVIVRKVKTVQEYLED